MINYLSRYSALSAHLAAPLSALTHKATDYKPGKVHLENFHQLKMEISNMKVLPYFDINAETTLQMDASKKGLRTCLIQKGKVVCYDSRALKKTEQNYQNLEREALGTIWGMEKFHYFLFGKEFTLETDQKPLVSIHKKHMVDISPRVQRLIVRSFPYIHEGHQGKERCLLRARNTVFWPKIMYDIQELIERCIICQEHGKSQLIIGTTQELPPFPWHTLATDIFYWMRMDFLIVTNVFSK